MQNVQKNKKLKMKLFIIFIIFSLLSGSSFNGLETKFNLDTKSSKVIWWANKSSGSFHNGFIDLDNNSYIVMNQDPNSPIDISGGEIVIDMHSITCYDIINEGSNKALVSHLKNEDFFDVENFPRAILKFTEAIEKNNGQILIKGNLTILEQTHPVEFISNPTFWTDENGKLIAGFKAEGVIPIDRALYGVKYKSKTWYKNLGDHFIDDIFYLYFSIISTDFDIISENKS